MDKLILKGEEFFSRGQIEDAEKCFTAIINQNPSCKEAFNNLGVIAGNQNRIKNAVEYFRQALRIDPSYPEALSNLADLSQSVKQNSNTEKIVDKKIAIVNPFDNKFNQIYSNYFGRHNEVKVIRASTKEEILALDSICDWADIIYCPWSNEPLIYLSNKKSDFLLVSNIRSYEIFFDESMNSINWNNVDGLIFVADHVRKIAIEKWLRQLQNIPQSTIYNSVELDKYPFHNKSNGRNIGYIGYLGAKKGVELLLQCISESVRVDAEYMFHIAGKFQGERFEHYARHLIEEMGLEKNVKFHGWVDDIPAFLEDINYIISTSPWEGCPNNIIEVMACGVKPLIHNWPGASDIFPKELIFTTISDFIKLLQSSSYESARYRDYVTENFNSAIQLPKIERFILSLSGKRGAEEKSKSSGVSLNLINRPERNENVSPQIVDRQGMKEEVNFLQPLPPKVEIVNNRKAFTVDFCRNKKVLHIGCVDSGMMKKRIAENNYLHHQIYKVADKLIGIDIDGDGITLLKNQGYDVETVNIETDREKLKSLTKEIDVIVVPEVIEHLSNPGLFLDKLYSCDFDGDILVSTPNSFSYRVSDHLSRGVELVHPDHNYYFSPTTLTTLLNKHGFDIKRLLMYYWPSNDSFGRQYEKILERSPYLAEGIIAVIKCNNV